jgi:NADH:ubiquinone oxidoreductase subunit 2 (subunit N)
MTAPVIWMIFPGLVGVVLYFFRRWFRLTCTIGTLVTGILSLAAWVLPIEEPINLGNISFRITENFQILGRSFVLTNQDRALVWAVFAVTTFWFSAVYIAKAGRNTVPLGMVFVAFLVAAITVEPLLYAAIMVELSVLASIPIFIQPGLPAVPLDRSLILGGIRFLVLQSLGMAFLLISAWTLSGIESMPDGESVLRISTLLAFGTAFVLGIFPFHTWVTGLMEKSHPYSAAFVFVVFLWMGLLVGMRFLDRYPWLMQVESTFPYLHIIGLFMILFGGVSAAFENHLGRMIGYGLIIDTGFGVLTAGYPGGYALLFSSLLPRVLTFGILSLSVNMIRTRVNGLTMMDISGIGLRLPLISSALVIALLSLVGLPMLAFFPIRMLLWELISGESLWVAVVSLMGPVGLLIAAVRVIMQFVDDSTKNLDNVQSNWQMVFFSVSAIILLFLSGIFPNWYSDSLAQGILSFPNLVP